MTNEQIEAVVTKGMREVTQAEFFVTIGPLNVHPSHMSPFYGSWETPMREVIGRSLPGYRNTGLSPKRWFLRETRHVAVHD